MNKVLTFYVRIKGLEDKIWRKIEIKESDTLADFSYFILASFELFSNEFFTITYDNNKYDSTSCLFDNDDYGTYIATLLRNADKRNIETKVLIDSFANITKSIELPDLPFRESFKQPKSIKMYLKQTTN